MMQMPSRMGPEAGGFDPTRPQLGGDAPEAIEPAGEEPTETSLLMEAAKHLEYLADANPGVGELVAKINAFLAKEGAAAPAAAEPVSPPA